MLVLYHSTDLSNLERFKNRLEEVGATSFSDEAEIASFRQDLLQKKIQEAPMLCILVGKKTAFSKEIQELIVLAKNIGCALLGVFMDFLISKKSVYYENPFLGYWIETEEDDLVHYILFRPTNLKDFHLNIPVFIKKTKSLRLDPIGLPINFSDLE